MKTTPAYKESKSESDSKYEAKISLKKEGDSANIRKIENGYIVSTTGTDDKGNYKNCETYYKENPLGKI